LILRSNQLKSMFDKQLVKLDWASTENGSHILTVCLANQVFVYSCVKKRKDSLTDIGITASEQKNLSAMSNSSSNQGIKANYLHTINENNKAQSNREKSADTHDDYEYYDNDGDEIEEPDSIVKWIQMRSFKIESADDMQALPTKMKWVRGGLLVLCLNTEMHVYSQWSPSTSILCPVATRKWPLNNELNIFAEENINNNNNSEKYKKFDRSGEQTNVENPFLIPKNHSILDLNKLNKLTSETGNKSKSIKQKQDKTRGYSNTDDNQNIKKKNARVYNENKILEIIGDSGLFMQAV
jgi:hypothetical protein